MAPTILIIDDDRFTRQVLSKILQRDKAISSYKPSIIEASNGMEGIRLFDVHKPTLAIVDLLMPKMDGFEVCKQLRERADPEDLSIAVTSGVYKDATVARRIRDEFHGEFFAKPYQIKKIADFVAKALAPTSSRHARAASQKEDTVDLSGKLKERGAAKVLLDMLEQEKTGRLMLRRGRVVRQIELYVGHPISVTSNVREETLGHFLVSKERISSEMHRKAMNLASRDRIRFGEALTQLGFLSANELITELTAQTRFKLVNALRWHTGTWSFRPCEPRNSNSNALNIVDVIVSGLATTLQLEPPPPTLTVLTGKPLSLTKRGQKLLVQIASSVSPSFAKHFTAGTTVERLETLGVNHVEVFSCLDVLLQCDGLEVGSSSGVPEKATSSISDSFRLHSIASANRGRRTGPDLIDSLFESNLSDGTRTGKSPLTTLGTEKLWKSLKTRTDASAPPADAEASSPDDFGDLELAEGEQEIHDEEKRRRRRSSLVRAQARKDDELVNVDFSDSSKLKIVVPEGRGAIVSEFLRIQDKSLYAVLRVADDASDEEIQAAHDEAVNEFDKAQYSKIELGRDFQKLDVLHATYKRCVETLLDNGKRSRYDNSLQSTKVAEGELPALEIPSLEAEIAFREGELLLHQGDHTGAMKKLREAVEIAPGEAAYQAELGWTVFLQGKKEPSAADEARMYINEALAMMPDDVLANEYKGLIDAHLGTDVDTALLHLEKALEGDPRRVEALRKIEEIRLGRGDYQELKQLYLRLLFATKGTSNIDEALIWCRLGDLHLHCLHDEEQGLVAYEAGLRLTPLDEEIKKKIRRIKGGDLASFYDANNKLVSSWQEAPNEKAPLHKLYDLAINSDHHDAAFIAASALVASGDALEKEDTCYQRNRPKYLIRAQRTLDNEAWTQHALASEDYALLGALYSLLAHSIQEVSPPNDAQDEVARANKLDEKDLPAEFSAVRSYVAHTLDVHEPDIYTHADYGRVIHVAALPTPALMVGRQTIDCSDKLELAFRLGRAMSFLRPGRAVVAGTPTRFLKSAMLACYSLRSPQVKVPDADGTVAKFKDIIARSDKAQQDQLIELVSHVSQEHPSLNLSRWVRMLNRTADRVGLLLCGDLPTSLRCLAEGSDPAFRQELSAFCASASHMRLRALMGLSVGV